MQTMWVHSIYCTVKIWKWTRFRKQNLKIISSYVLQHCDALRKCSNHGKQLHIHSRVQAAITQFQYLDKRKNMATPVSNGRGKENQHQVQFKLKKIAYSIFDNSNEWFSVTLKAHLNQETSKTITVQIPTGLWLSSAQHRVSTRFGVPSV